MNNVFLLCPIYTMATRKHASGFDHEGYTQHTPMRVSRILDKLTINRHMNNYVPIVFTVAQLVKTEHPTMSKWHLAIAIVEVLNFIPELDELSTIFESSADHVLLQLAERERVCSTCFPM